MHVLSLQHINIDTWQPADTIAFYTDVLGLEFRPEARPESSQPGAWLFLGDEPVVQLTFHDIEHVKTDVQHGEPAEPLNAHVAESTGNLNHIAFTGQDFERLCRLLEERDHHYRTTVDGAVQRVFTRDPNGVAIEINITQR